MEEEKKSDEKGRYAFLRFIIVGIIATALHYGLYVLLQQWLPVGIAYTVGYVMSLVVNFILTARFTFGAKASGGRAVGFVGAHGVNYLLHMVLLWFFLQMGVPKVAAPIPVLAIAVPVNFLLVRFVFKKIK